LGVAAVEPGGDILDTREAGPRIIRGGLVRGAGYVVNNLIALLGVMLVTRYLGVADFGRFQTIFSLITVVATVTDAGMATLGMREYAQRAGEDRNRLMRSLLGLRLGLTLVGAAIAAAIAAGIGYDAELVLGAALGGLGLALTVVQTTLAIPLAVGLRNVALTALDIGRQLLTVGGYGIVVLAGGGVVALLGVTVPVGIAMVVAAAALVRGQVPLAPSFRVPEWGRLLVSSAAFVMATAVGTIYLFTAQILTAAVTDARATGLFAASFRIFVVLAAVPGLLITVAFPLLSRAARDDRDRLAYAVQRLEDTTGVLGPAAAIVLVLGAPAVLDVVAGPDFAAAAPALRIQAATLLASFVLAPIGFALLSIHAHRGILVANALAFGVTMAAVAILASSLGSEGAALATVIGEWTLALGYLVALRRVSPDIVPGFAAPARAIAAAAACLLLAFLPLPSWLLAVCGVAVYAVLVLVLRAVPAELLELLPRPRPRR
jgi:O-antigen/teichoic acid export membrane protein